MKGIEKIAIKYLLIGFGVGILKILMILFPGFYFDYDFSDSETIRVFQSFLITYSANIIIGLFLLFDSIKYTRNKILIPILGLCLPVFGVCFLIMEKYLILKSDNNE